MPELMNCELLATCNALGCAEGSTYHKEPDCLETVRDLIRFLRREDDTREIRRQLGHAQIVQNDLIPIIVSYHEDDELFETVIRLLVNLTQPAELCFGNKIPEDKTFRHYFLEIQNHLQASKEHFADEDFMAVLARKLKELLDLEWEDRREEHTLLMERILLLVRNILHVPADPNEEKRTDDDASIHDQVLWVLNTSGMDKLLLYIASAEGEQQWCMHAIEIISLMLREQDPEQIARAGIGRSSVQKEQDDRELEMMRQREQAERKSRVKQFSTRHSRFGGTFCLKNVKSISDKDLIYHRSPITTDSITFDREKAPKRKPRNRRPMRDSDTTRRSTLSIRLFLKEFCTLFLENCYNPLMHAVRDSLLHDRAQKNDESYYLWTMRFFMEFSRHHSFRIDVISETFSVQSFHYIETNLQNYYEMMLTDKKEVTQWSRRMHLAMRAYKELLLSLDAMGHSKDSSLVDSANVIKSNIFYVMEYREIFVTLLRKYDPVRLSRNFLKDLIETTHVFVKMLEKFTKGRRSVLVQKKRRKKKKKQQKPRNTEESSQTAGALPEEELDELWDRVSSDMSAMLQGREEIPDNAVPFDAAADIPVEEQRANAMIQIQQATHNAQGGEAIALFRAAREVWPENDIFGASDISPEDEFMAIREIHYANLPRPNQTNVENDENDLNEEEEIEEEEEEIIETNYAEEEFNFDGYVKRYAHPGVLSAYVILLANYRKNSLFTNHCIVKMLHRVAWDCKMVPLLFQISLFRVFQKILTDPAVETANLKEAAKFAKFIAGHFFSMAQNNSKLFVEILFWKDHKEVYELTEGYGTAQERQSTKRGVEWKEEEEEELKQLFEEYKDQADEDEGKDVVDYIMEHIIDDTKTRRQIIRQLVRQELLQSAADLKRKTGSKRRVWREEHELELRTLFDQHRDSNDILGSIIEDMTEKRSRQAVTNKLLEMGLVSDKKELYKKRKKKSDTAQKKTKKDDFINDDDDDDDDDELEEVPPSDDEDEDERYGKSSSDSNSDEDDDDGDELGGLSTAQLVSKVNKQGFKEQIKWILTGLRRTADDRETENDTEAVPIVPLTEENEAAMQNGTFTSFLKKIGMAPPADHQEIFWRIPGTLSPDDLRDLADSIEGMGEGDDSEGQQGKKKSNARHQKLKELARARKQDRKSEEKEKRRKRLSEKKAMAALIGDGEEKSEQSPPSRPKEKQRRVQRNIADSSDDEMMNQGEEELNGNETNSESETEQVSSGSVTRKSSGSKHLRPMDSDSENDDDELSRKDNRKEKSRKRKSKAMQDEDIRKANDDDSDEDDVRMTVARQQSDEESNDAGTHQSSKKSRIVDSDSDSDDEPLIQKASGKPRYSVEETPLPEDTQHMNLRLSSLDSDEESAQETSVKTQESHAVKKVLDSSDEDDDLETKGSASESIQAKRPYTAIQSDSDSDIENVPLKRIVRRKIESDSDDE
ncbi:protein timeless homolog [Ptychodera flava]|uniref:protein timeless homolog n=1 Tax=Ptychodera flava TaxID=63121 RepID=UPI00396A7779